MPSVADVLRLLDELEMRPADELESQELDFEEWNARSRNDAVALVVEMAVCMANGGGGTTVFGINDRALGRAAAILGDARLRRVAALHRSSGTGKIRVGTDCMPLMGTLRRRIMVETRETDFTAVEVGGDPGSLVSVVAMERLRDAARRERAPDDLLRLSDLELLRNAGVVRPSGRLTRAGLLIAGREEALQEHVANHAWTHFRVKADTDYSDPLHGRGALPVPLARLEERILADNPVQTVQVGRVSLGEVRGPDASGGVREARARLTTACPILAPGRSHAPGAS